MSTEAQIASKYPYHVQVLVGLDNHWEETADNKLNDKDCLVDGAEPDFVLQWTPNDSRETIC